MYADKLLGTNLIPQSVFDMRECSSRLSPLLALTDSVCRICLVREQSQYVLRLVRSRSERSYTYPILDLYGVPLDTR